LVPEPFRTACGKLSRYFHVPASKTKEQLYLFEINKIKYTYTQLADGVNRPVLQLSVEQQYCELNVIWFDLPHIEQSAEHPYIIKFIPISVYDADCFE